MRMQKDANFNNARQCAAFVVQECLHSDGFAKDILDQSLKSSQLSPRDTGLATELVYGTLRWYGALLDSLNSVRSDQKKEIDRRIIGDLLVAAYQLQHLGERIPARAAVNECVDLVRLKKPGMAAFTNALLRNLPNAPHLSISEDSSIAEVAKAYFLPYNLIKAFYKKRRPDQRLALYNSLNQRPQLGVHFFDFQQEKSFQEQAQKDVAALESHQIANVQFHPFVPNSYLLKRKTEHLFDDLREKKLIIQDPGSVLVALLLDVMAGMSVLDMCAAPGTKTQILLNNMRLAEHNAFSKTKEINPNSALLAQDISERRAEKLKFALESYHRVTVNVVDSCIENTLEKKPESSITAKKFDAILLDAPCSGFGTTRRRPEIKIRRPEGADLATLKVQAALLESAAGQLKVCGALVYAVCSPLPQEGSQQIRKFLEKHPEFTIQNAQEILPNIPDNALNEDGSVSLAPDLHQCDAFYMVRLIKKGDTPCS